MPSRAAGALLLLDRGLELPVVDQPSVHGQAAEPLADVEVEIVGRLETEFGVVGRQSPRKFLAHRLIGFDDALGGVFDLFDGQRVQRIFERHPQPVAVEREREGSDLRGQFRRNLGQRFGHDVDPGQHHQWDPDRFFDGAGDPLFGDDADVDQDVGQSAADLRMAADRLLERIVIDVTAFEKHGAEAFVTYREDGHVHLLLRIMFSSLRAIRVCGRIPAVNGRTRIDMSPARLAPNTSVNT